VVRIQSIKDAAAETVEYRYRQLGLEFDVEFQYRIKSWSSYLKKT